MTVRTANGSLRLRNGVAALVATGTVNVVAPPPQLSVSAFNLIFDGQSNMAHMLSGDGQDALTTSPTAQESHGGVRSPIIANDPSGHYPLGTGYYGSNGYGNNPGAVVRGGTNTANGVAYFANNLFTATGLPLVMYGYPVSGTDIGSWMAGASNSNWTPVVNAVNADPKGAGTNCAIWYQGENDIGQSKAYYKGRLRTLHDQHLALAGMTATPQNYYFGIVILGPSNGYGDSVNGTGCAAIRQAQLEYINENVGAYLAGVATDMNLAGGDIHITQASLETLARRYPVALTAWAQGSTSKWCGPRITGATRSGLTVTPKISGGTGAYKDGAGGAGSSLQLFRFFDAGAGGAQIAYTSAIIGGAPVLTLASAPVGALTMDCGMANAPLGANAAPAGWLYDSTVIPGSDGRGLPLIPCAPITVTGS